MNKPVSNRPFPHRLSEAHTILALNAGLCTANRTALRTGYSRRSVQLALAELVAREWVTRREKATQQGHQVTFRRRKPARWKSVLVPRARALVAMKARKSQGLL